MSYCKEDCFHKACNEQGRDKMTELKTLRELADENGFPFEATAPGLNIHCLGISPKGYAVGWNSNGYGEYLEDSQKRWTLVTPKKKYVEALLTRYDGTPIISWWQSEEEAKVFADEREYRFIKTLREIEIDE